jgi:hypothetical protein
VRVYGIDFTSSPRRSKPITCAACKLNGERLILEEIQSFDDFMAFERQLAEQGRWIAGIDFPFGQSRRFIENIGWPTDWQRYVAHVAKMDRLNFRQRLDDYRAPRPAGDKEHRRKVDALAGSISPQKLYGVPVGLMFFEGAPRLLASSAHIPLIRPRDDDRVIVEAYPGVLARRLIGHRSYKHDSRRRQTADQLAARQAILEALENVEAPADVVDDPTGDQLDALLCAVQAAWAWSKHEENFGIPSTADTLEGWIVDESLYVVAA